MAPTRVLVNQHYEFLKENLTLDDISLITGEDTIQKRTKLWNNSVICATPEIAKRIDDLYKSIITAGTHMAPSIKVAEAAKVIENSQRDINIAFVNELSKIFRLLDIDTEAVLKAAGTKWNFFPGR